MTALQALKIIIVLHAKNNAIPRSSFAPQDVWLRKALGGEKARLNACQYMPSGIGVDFSPRAHAGFAAGAKNRRFEQANNLRGSRFSDRYFSLQNSLIFKGLTRVNEN